METIYYGHVPPARNRRLSKGCPGVVLRATQGDRNNIPYNYSLGIVLLEIGLWRPLNEITQKYPLETPYEEIRDRLLKERIPLLKQSMGRRYCEAVRVCLAGDFGESEIKARRGGNAKLLHLSFERLVVSQLRRVSI